MAAPKTKTSRQRMALRLEIYKRFCCGEPQASIAAALGVHQTNVAYHVAKAKDTNQIEIAHRRADRLRELDRVRSEAWTAWEADRSPQAVAFLAQIQKAIAQERALLGLDTAKSVTASIALSELPTDTLDTVIEGPQKS